MAALVGTLSTKIAGWVSVAPIEIPAPLAALTAKITASERSAVLVSSCVESQLALSSPSEKSSTSGRPLPSSMYRREA